MFQITILMKKQDYILHQLSVRLSNFVSTTPVVVSIGCFDGEEGVLQGVIKEVIRKLRLMGEFE